MIVATFFLCFGFCLPLLGVLETSQLRTVFLKAVFSNLYSKCVVKRFQPSGRDPAVLLWRCHGTIRRSPARSVASCRLRATGERAAPAARGVPGLRGVRGAFPPPGPAASGAEAPGRLGPASP